MFLQKVEFSFFDGADAFESGEGEEEDEEPVEASETPSERDDQSLRAAPGLRNCGELNGRNEGEEDEEGFAVDAIKEDGEDDGENPTDAGNSEVGGVSRGCLLYTSDAADE